MPPGVRSSEAIMAISPRVGLVCFILSTFALPAPAQTPSLSGTNSTAGSFRFNSAPGIRLNFDGFAGERIQAMVDQWLLPAPAANPGMLEMFRVRDREPKPNLVPWAGEFVGKYLISAIQTLRMTESPALRHTTEAVVQELISTQADDGYLGPFTLAERLRGHWDLWGHYHCMLGLLMWHEATGHAGALQTARKAADLVCATYLDSSRRAIDAGSDEMNLAISHSLGWLYRLTREPRYLRMMHEIEKDWERGGDYLRKGLEGVEFYQSPRPRWESLHNLQALVEFFQITGEPRYKDAFEHHWRSIARFDLRNTGGFSSGEQATGNPYAPTAVETCCTIAWMCLSVDMLKLTGDSRVADKLELATWNAWAGAQHPSGRWCTYSTPMDGARQASAHEIVFQARAGTPELNCCSVNGPRGWSMLADWATMKANDGLVQNWLGPATATLSLGNGNRVKVHTRGEYPVQPLTALTLDPDHSEEFTLHVRIPQWSRNTSAELNGAPVAAPRAGTYLSLRRVWKKGDTLALKWDFTPQTLSGDKDARGKVSLYRGPLLLAWDQRFDAKHDEKNLPILDASALTIVELSSKAERTATAHAGKPLLLVQANDGSGESLPLCDFASAGATGTRYRSWLPASKAPAPEFLTQYPRDGASLPRGDNLFRYKAPRGAAPTAALEFSDREDDFSHPFFKVSEVSKQGAVVTIDKRFEPGKWIFWRAVSASQPLANIGFYPAARFQVDPNLPLTNAVVRKPPATGPKGELLLSPLGKFPAPTFGQWKESNVGTSLNGQGIQLNGSTEKLLYTLEEWPEEDYSLTVAFRIEQLPRNRLGQIFSAWCRGSDDPLRLVIDNGKLFARIEAGQAYSTEGVTISTSHWHIATVIKEGSKLILYLDGVKRSSTSVPEEIHTQARHIALGGNPLYTGNEHLAVSFSHFAFYNRALKESEIPKNSR